MSIGQVFGSRSGGAFLAEASEATEGGSSLTIPGHFHRERNHQGLENRLIQAEEGHLGASGAIQQQQRLGGLLNYYYRAAA
jgi:hypothetical protein